MDQDLRSVRERSTYINDWLCLTDSKAAKGRRYHGLCQERGFLLLRRRRGLYSQCKAVGRLTDLTEMHPSVFQYNEMHKCHWFMSVLNVMSRVVYRSLKERFAPLAPANFGAGAKSVTPTSVEQKKSENFTPHPYSLHSWLSLLSVAAIFLRHASQKNWESITVVVQLCPFWNY